MFSIFVYAFSAAVSFLASRHFFRAWKKNPYPPYWEFSAFFFTLGIAFLVYIFPFVFGIVPVSGAWTEAGNFLSLFAFAFVLRAIVRFQNLSFSPNLITASVAFLTILKCAIGLAFPTEPIRIGILIYWQYPHENYIAYSVLISLFTVAMALTLLSNIKNVQKNRGRLLFLGTAFFTGGVGGAFTVSSYVFGPLLFGYVLLLLTFFLVALFVFTPTGRAEQ